MRKAYPAERFERIGDVWFDGVDDSIGWARSHPKTLPSGPRVGSAIPYRSTQDSKARRFVGFGRLSAELFRIFLFAVGHRLLHSEVFGRRACFRRPLRVNKRFDAFAYCCAKRLLVEGVSVKRRAVRALHQRRSFLEGCTDKPPHALVDSSPFIASSMGAL